MLRRTVILMDAQAGLNGGGGGGATLTPEQFQARVLTGITSVETQVRGIETAGAKHGTDIVTLQTNLNTITTELAEIKKQRLGRSLMTSTLKRAGFVSEECALELASTFLIHCERSGKMEAVSSSKSERDNILDVARRSLGLTVKAAITTTEVPLPTVYGGEIKELISQFGVVRKAMFPYPIGMGTARPARMGTRPAFASIAQSAAFGELVPALTFASLESHKIGGIVRLPREIDEQSIVPMGQFLARYGAVEFARAEDTWGFLADGTATYESVSGVAAIAAANAKVLTLAAGKTKPSDATLADFRALRRLVNKAALSGKLSAYYLDTTWETALPAFRTQQEPLVYQRLPDGSGILDGYPIIWTDVMQAYGTAAAASKTLCAFGALSFWWLGEHGSPRIDTSDQVYFANDQLATRFIEEIDFDYAAVDAMATMATPAA